MHGDGGAALSDLELVAVRKAAEPVVLVDLCWAFHEAAEGEIDLHIATERVGPSPRDDTPDGQTASPCDTISYTCRLIGGPEVRSRAGKAG